MSWEAKDSWTLGISLGSLAITVGWNLYNQFRTDRIARQIRSESYQIDQWMSSQDRVLTALRTFEALGAELDGLSQGVEQADELKKLVAGAGRKLSHAWTSLGRELNRVDARWFIYAQGAVVDPVTGDTDWDQVNALLAAIARKKSAPRMRDALATLRPHIDAISTSVTNAVRERSASLDPEKL